MLGGLGIELKVSGVSSGVDLMSLGAWGLLLEKGVIDAHSRGVLPNFEEEASGIPVCEEVQRFGRGRRLILSGKKGKVDWRGLAEGG